MSDSSMVTVRVQIDPEVHLRLCLLAKRYGLRRAKVYSLAFEFASYNWRFVNEILAKDFIKKPTNKLD